MDGARKSMMADLAMCIRVLQTGVQCYYDFKTVVQWCCLSLVIALFCQFMSHEAPKILCRIIGT
jgi:hypothetical protein